MLKPRVGETVEVSSPLMRFTIVVLPALSSPLQAGNGAGQEESQEGGEQCRLGRHSVRVLQRVLWAPLPPLPPTHTSSRRSSRSFRLTLRMMVSSPMLFTS